MQGRIVSINIAERKGDKKLPVEQAELVLGQGVTGDAHLGGERQVSVLAREDIDAAAKPGLKLEPGDFGENLTTLGIDTSSLRIGQRLLLGTDAILQISEIGKVCVEPCGIGRRLGNCIMQTQGTFAKVVRGGQLRSGDPISATSTKAGAVLVSSDRCSRGERKDESGPLLVRLLEELDVAVSDYVILPDEEAELAARLKFWADRCALDLILTTGGTGFGTRDRMPEAALAVLDSQAPGIAEAIRHEGMRHTAYACLSRGVSGLRGRTLIVNLPGSTKAIEQTSDLLRAVIPHVLEILRSEVTDCGHREN